MTSRPEPSRPLLTVVRDDATPEELAALVSILVARSEPGRPATPARSLWSQPALRTPLSPGTDGWRRSALRG